MRIEMDFRENSLKIRKKTFFALPIDLSPFFSSIVDLAAIRSAYMLRKKDLLAKRKLKT